MEIEDVERIKAYIDNVELALKNIDIDRLRSSEKHIIELVKDYLYDSKYYLEKGDLFTSLACIAYAEGLLDCLKRLGIVNFKWKPLSELMARPKVVVGGTFEIIHPGHIYFLEKASEYGRVYVIVARDEEISKKGQPVIFNQRQRMQMIDAIKYVDLVIAGKEDKKEVIKRIKPDIIAIGYDQKITFSMDEELGKVRIIRIKRKI